MFESVVNIHAMEVSKLIIIESKSHRGVVEYRILKLF